MGKAIKKVTTVKKTSKEDLERKKRLAYTLYVDNGFEQKVIADITGISERSISKWKIEGKWDDDKEEAQMDFQKQRKRIRRHIDTLLTNIEKRDPPNNIPTASEGDTLNKLADAVRKLQTELSYSHRVEAGKQFIRYIQEMYGQDKAIDVVKLWHEYLMATK